MFELVVEKTIAAAHYLRDFSGPCERLHGHNYKIEVYLRGSALSKSGMLEDFTDIKRAMNDVLGRLDHHCLNDLPEFADVSPSTENVARFIGDALATFPFERGRVHRVRVWETPTQSATYFVEQSAQD